MISRILKLTKQFTKPVKFAKPPRFHLETSDSILEKKIERANFDNCYGYGNRFTNSNNQKITYLSISS